MSFNREQRNVVGDATINPLEVDREIMRKIQKSEWRGLWKK